jgi:hypothetical protein
LGIVSRYRVIGGTGLIFYQSVLLKLVISEATNPVWTNMLKDLGLAVFDSNTLGVEHFIEHTSDLQRRAVQPIPACSEQRRYDGSVQTFEIASKHGVAIWESITSQQILTNVQGFTGRSIHLYN